MPALPNCVYAVETYENGKPAGDPQLWLVCYASLEIAKGSVEHYARLQTNPVSEWSDFEQLGFTGSHARAGDGTEWRILPLELQYGVPKEGSR